MKSILKATAILSSASAVSIAMGVVSAKILSVLLGPSGMGYMGLLQSVLGLSVMIAGMGVGAGIVRSGAPALQQNDAKAEAALRTGAWILFLLIGGITAMLLILLRASVSRAMLGDVRHEGAVVIITAGVLLTMAAGILSSILNAHHRVSELARLAILNSIFGVACTVLIIWKWQARGIVWAVLAGCLINWAVSFYYARKSTPRPTVQVSGREAWSAARTLLRFGGPYTASMLVGAGTLLVLPILVLHALGTENVGFYRAAAAISVNYLGFLIAAMAQDYYPRVSAVSNNPEQLCRLINEQHRLLLLIAAPIILGMLALVPYLVPLVYSPKFVPATALLEWQLIGDILKFGAWTMSFVILARSGSLVFFLIEFIGGATMLLFSWIGMRWLGLEGLGLGFVGCCTVYYIVCLIILRRDIALRWSKTNLLIFLAAIAFAVVVRVLPYIGLIHLRTPLALILAALAASVSVYVIWGELGGVQAILKRRSTPTQSGEEAIAPAPNLQ